MPLYRFHLSTPDKFERDDEGLTFTDLDAAYLSVWETIPLLSADLLREGRDPLVCTFIIADAGDRALMEVPFRERVRQSHLQPAAASTPLLVGQARRLLADVRKERSELWVNLNHLHALLAASWR